MVLHKLTYTAKENPENEVHKWFGSEREAVVFRMGLIKSGKISTSRKDNPIGMHEVPVRKQELIAWLNEYENK